MRSDVYIWPPIFGKMTTFFISIAQVNNRLTYREKCLQLVVSPGQNNLLLEYFV